MNWLFALLRLLVLGVLGRMLAARRLSKPIRIVLLGYPASGKTVYWASMYHQLALGAGHRGNGLRLSADLPTSRELINTYNQVADPAQSFLPPTPPGDMRHWRFTCQFVPEAGDSARDVTTFDCLDYSGDTTQDLFAMELTDVTADFANTIKDIDVVFGVLDGQQVYRLMQGDPTARFYDDVRILVHLMAPHPYIHFVLTKWDMFAPEYKLDEIVRRLMQIPDFRMLAGARPRGTALRVIPVSSFGPGFARPAPGGRMEKVPGRLPDPINLALPIACAYTDVMRRRVRTIATVKYATRRSNAFILLRPLAWIVRQMTLTFNVSTFGLSFQFIAQTASASQAARKPLRTRDGRPVVDNRRNAIEYTYGQFLGLVNRLDHDHRQNNLTTFGEC